MPALHSFVSPKRSDGSAFGFAPGSVELRRSRTHLVFRRVVPASQLNRGEETHEREKNHPSPVSQRN
jgi:hypothetical protein